MTIADKFSLPVALKDWKPGSYNKRHYGIKHKHPDTGKDVYHTGTDIKLPFKTNVRAIADGEIVRIDYNPLEFGRLIVVKHQLSEDPENVIFSTYMHLSVKDGHRNRTLREGVIINRGEWLGDVGHKDENGDGEEHLHYGLYKGKAPKESNGLYSHVFVGYGKLENEINLEGKSHAEKIDVYRTVERIGGNAIDPVEFMDNHISHPIDLPDSLHTFKINQSADPEKSGEAIFTKIFQRPSNGRYILRFSGKAKSGKQNYPRKLRGNDDDGWWTLNGIDPRGMLDSIFQGVWGFNGSDSQNYPKEFWVFVDTKSSFGDLTDLNQGEQEFVFSTDESPFIDTVEILPWSDAGKVSLDFFEQAPSSGLVDVGGLPWKNFLFLGCPPTNAILTGSARSALMCGVSDDEGMQVYKNRNVIRNPFFPDSRKYGTSAFSGDQDKGAIKPLELGSFPKKAFNSVELWVDNQPLLEKVTFEF